MCSHFCTQAHIYNRSSHLHDFPARKTEAEEIVCHSSHQELEPYDVIKKGRMVMELGSYYNGLMDENFLVVSELYLLER